MFARERGRRGAWVRVLKKLIQASKVRKANCKENRVRPGAWEHGIWGVWVGAIMGLML